MDGRMLANVTLLTSNSAGVILEACPPGWCCHDIHEQCRVVFPGKQRPTVHFK